MAKILGIRCSAKWQVLDDGLEVLDGVRCELGEGIFFDESGHVACWFDIDKNRYYMFEGSSLLMWELPMTATAGYQRDGLSFVMAAETGLRKVEV